MRASTKKLTTAAVCTALSVIMCAACAYLPLSFMPLYLAAFCIFLACKRANILYGLLCAVASVGIMFAMSGLNVKWFLFLIMFAPYGIIAHFISRFSYFKVKSGLIRAATVIVFFNLAFGAVYLIATRALSSGLDIDIAAYAMKLGGYPVLALVTTLILVPLDFIFCGMASVILKRIPAPVERRPPPAVDGKSQPDSDVFDENNAQSEQNGDDSSDKTDDK